MTTHQLILPQLNLCQFPCRLCYYRMEPKKHGVHQYYIPYKDNHSPEKIILFTRTLLVSIIVNWMYIYVKTLS